MRRHCTVEYCGIDWKVEGEYNKGRPAMFYLPNGDPGYPAEPSELYNIEVWIQQGGNVSDDLVDILTPDTVSDLIDKALLVLEEDDETMELPL